jgi:hypothetical protein
MFDPVVELIDVATDEPVNAAFSLILFLVFFFGEDSFLVLILRV